MKVSSPVGEFPFEPRALSLRERRLRLDGAIGAWPAHVEIGAADLPPLLRLAGPLLPLALAIAALVLLLNRRRP